MSQPWRLGEGLVRQRTVVSELAADPRAEASTVRRCCRGGQGAGAQRTGGTRRVAKAVRLERERAAQALDIQRQLEEDERTHLEIERLQQQISTLHKRKVEVWSGPGPGCKFRKKP